MTEYYAKSTNSLSFDVTKEDQLIGKLIYKNWFKFNATMEIANDAIYQVEPKGFWGTTVEVKDKEKVLLDFQLNWNGDIVIQTYFNDTNKGYIFKYRGFFKDSYILTNQDKVELLVFKPHFKWNKLNYEYQITTSDMFDGIPEKEILLMNSLHCANYFMLMMMGQ